LTNKEYPSQHTFYDIVFNLTLAAAVLTVAISQCLSIPAVTKDWLLTCYAEKTWVSEKPFLVGGSTVFTKGKPMPKKTVNRLKTFVDKLERLSFDSKRAKAFPKGPLLKSIASRLD
jgi:hypothetical protein